jgi:hypothetical protein
VAAEAALMPSQADFVDLWRDTRTDLRTLADGYASGHLTATEFGDEVTARLEDGHAAAVSLGRAHAGDDTPEAAEDRKFAEQIVDEQVEYLAAFVKDLESGRYRDEHGNEDAQAIGDRVALYANRMTGTANEAWALSEGQDTEVNWTLDDGAQNCADCPDIASGSPYTFETLPSYPGDGSTECNVFCRCEIETADGKAGFKLPSEDEE